MGVHWIKSGKAPMSMNDSSVGVSNEVRRRAESIRTEVSKDGQDKGEIEAETHTGSAKEQHMRTDTSLKQRQGTKQPKWVLGASR